MSMISVEMFMVKIWLSMKAPLKVLEFPALHHCIRYNELFLQMVIFSCFGDNVVELVDNSWFAGLLQGWSFAMLEDLGIMQTDLLVGPEEPEWLLPLPGKTTTGAGRILAPLSPGSVWMRRNSFWLIMKLFGAKQAKQIERPLLKVLMLND